MFVRSSVNPTRFTVGDVSCVAVYGHVKFAHNVHKERRDFLTFQHRFCAVVVGRAAKISQAFCFIL